MMLRVYIFLVSCRAAVHGLISYFHTTIGERDGAKSNGQGDGSSQPSLLDDSKRRPDALFSHDERDRETASGTLITPMVIMLKGAASGVEVDVDIAIMPGGRCSFPLSRI
jgi:hypothetical protein